MFTSFNSDIKQLTIGLRKTYTDRQKNMFRNILAT